MSFMRERVATGNTKAGICAMILGLFQVLLAMMVFILDLNFCHYIFYMLFGLATFLFGDYIYWEREKKEPIDFPM